MFILNAKTKTCMSYYTGNCWLDRIPGELYLRLAGKIIHALSYFWLLTSVRRMWTDSMLTVLALERCLKMDRRKTALEDRFKRYNFTSGEVLGLEEKSVQERECARKCEVASRLWSWQQLLYFSDPTWDRSTLTSFDAIMKSTEGSLRVRSRLRILICTTCLISTCCEVKPGIP